MEIQIYTQLFVVHLIYYEEYFEYQKYKSVYTVKKWKIQNTEEDIMFDFIEFLYRTIFENIRYHIDYKTNKIIST